MFKMVKNILKGKDVSQSVDEFNVKQFLEFMSSKVNTYLLNLQKGKDVDQSVVKYVEQFFEFMSSKVNTWPIFEKLNRMNLAAQLHGVVNIESGRIGIYTGYFDDEKCSGLHSISNATNLCACGRSSENFISLRCGDGDGLYPVFALIDLSLYSYEIVDEEIKNEYGYNYANLSSSEIGYLIQCNTSITEHIVDNAVEGVEVLNLITPEPKLINENHKSYFYFFGKFLNLDKIFISDAQATLNGADAILSSNYPKLGEYYIFAICLHEPRDGNGILSNISNNKLPDTVIVPRNIIVIHKDYAEDLLALAEPLPRNISQIENEWLNSVINSHLQPIPNFTYKRNADIYYFAYGRNDIAGSWLVQAHQFEGEDFFTKPHFEESWSDILPKLAPTVEQLSYLYASRGLLDCAEKISLDFINSHLEVMTEEVATTINSLVYGIYTPQRKFDKGTALLQRVIHEFSGLQVGIAFGNLGIIEIESDEILKAKDSFTKSLEIVEGTWAEDEPLYYLGSIALQEGDKEGAISFLEKCLEHLPSGGKYPQLAKIKYDEIFR